MIRPARIEGKTWENVSRAIKKEKYNDLRFKICEKEPFDIHLRVKRHDTPINGRKERKRNGANLIFSILCVNPR
jgi:hypothetical protein